MSRELFFTADRWTLAPASFMSNRWEAPPVSTEDPVWYTTEMNHQWAVSTFGDLQQTHFITHHGEDDTLHTMCFGVTIRAATRLADPQHPVAVCEECLSALQQVTLSGFDHQEAWDKRVRS